jgi:hypothetical protein
MKTYLTLPFVFVISLFTFNAVAQNNNTDSSAIAISKKVVGKDGKSLFIGSYKKIAKFVKENSNFSIVMEKLKLLVTTKTIILVEIGFSTITEAKSLRR